MEIKEMVEKLRGMGASDEDIKALWMMAIETANEIVEGE